ncbi:MAG: group II intron maturase-specific domain-containing protein [Planctomycetota bacterium]
MTELSRYPRGWIGYFGLARQFDEFVELDGWIRHRVRTGYWKPWRYPRTKVRHLVHLGVDLEMAIKHAISRKRDWRMSRTPAMRYATGEQVAGATRASLAQAALGADCSSSWNRLVRTRLLGGVGLGGATRPATRFLPCLCSVFGRREFPKCTNLIWKSPPRAMHLKVQPVGWIVP